MVVPFRWRTTLAMNVSSLSSLTMTWVTFAPRSLIIESIRSWVNGRGTSLPSSFSAMESPSADPTQIGRHLSTPFALRTTIRWWPAGFTCIRSIVTSSMSMFSFRWMCVRRSDQLAKPCSAAITRWASRRDRDRRASRSSGMADSRGSASRKRTRAGACPARYDFRRSLARFLRCSRLGRAGSERVCIGTPFLWPGVRVVRQKRVLVVSRCGGVGSALARTRRLPPKHRPDDTERARSRQ